MNTNKNHLPPCCSVQEDHSRCRQSPISDFAEDLIREMNDNKRRNTARMYQSTIKRLMAFSGNEHLSFDDITPDLLRKYEACLRQENLSPNTVSFYLRSLRMIFNKAVDRKLVHFENRFGEIK
jgi:site-specific recombinase XerD